MDELKQLKRDYRNQIEYFLLFIYKIVGKTPPLVKRIWFDPKRQAFFVDARVRCGTFTLSTKEQDISLLASIADSYWISGQRTIFRVMKIDTRKKYI